MSNPGNSKRWGDVLVPVLGAAVFTVPAIHRVQLTRPSILSLMHGMDDWNSYAQYALDIIKNGVLIHAVEGDYVQPAGFLYNHFVALCLILFNNNLGAVYLVQASLLGVSVGVLYLAFKDHVGTMAKYLLLACLIGFGFIDVYKVYTFRLLSENLALPLTACFFFIYGLNIGSNSYWRLMGLALLLGSATLVRPNMILFAASVALLSLFGMNGLGHSWPQRLVFVGLLLIVLSLLPLRNLAVGESFRLLATDAHYLSHIRKWNAHVPGGNDLGGFMLYIKKFLFCLGFNNVLEPAYSIRPHWMAMWAGVFLWGWQRIAGRQETSSMEWMVLIFLISFYSVIIAVGAISNYGFRLLVPSILIPMGISIKGYESAWSNLIGKTGRT